MIQINNKNQYFLNKNLKDSSFFYFNIKKYLRLVIKHNDGIINSIVCKQKSNFLIISIFIQPEKKTENFDINKIENNINLYLKSFKYPLKSKIYIIALNMKILNRGKAYSHIFKYYKTQKRHNLLYLTNIAIYTKNANLLNFLLVRNLKKTRRHKQYLRNFNTLLTNLFKFYSSFTGYKIQLKGRINGIARSNKFVIEQGSVSKNSFNSNIVFDSQSILTSFGIISIKTWLVFKTL